MANRLKLHARAQEKFLEVLRQTANVSEACRAIGMSNRGVYDRRDADPAFRAAWDEAVSVAVDRLEREAFRRAVEGWPEPVFYKGQECGAIRKYSDRMLELLLCGHRPMYRQKSEPVKSDTPPVFVVALARPGRDPLALHAAPPPETEDAEITEQTLDVSRLVEMFRPPRPPSSAPDGV